MTQILASHAAQVHPFPEAWVLAIVAWAALIGMVFLCRPLYRRRPSTPARQSRPEPAEVYEVTELPAFEQPYAVGENQ